MEVYQEEPYQDDQWEEDPLTSLQWDEDFYNAVDDSIYKVVEEAMARLEDHLSRRIEQACEKLARASQALPAPLSCDSKPLLTPSPRRQAP